MAHLGSATCGSRLVGSSNLLRSRRGTCDTCRDSGVKLTIGCDGNRPSIELQVEADAISCWLLDLHAPTRDGVAHVRCTFVASREQRRRCQGLRL